MTTASGAFILLLLLLLTCFFSASEAAITSISKAKLKAMAEVDKKAEKALKLYEHYDKTLTTIVVCNNIINILIPTLATIIFLQLIPNETTAAITSTIVVSIILILFGEIIPKLYGKEKNEKLLLNFSGLILLLTKLSIPFTIFFTATSSFFKKHAFKAENEEDSLVEIEEELLNIIEESVEEGDLTEEEEEIIRNAIEFNDKKVEEVLQPKASIVSIDVTDEISDILEVFKENKYSRVPVYEDNEDNFIGVITEREFLQEYIINKDFDLRTILREVKYVPDTLKISTLLPQLQKARMHMAIVIDERATVQGIVTVEDMIEEIVGDIWDEHDDIEVKIWRIANGFGASGEVSINEFNTYFDEHINVESEETTIAGYIIEEMQKIPQTNDVFENDHFKFKMTEVTNNKIERIAIYPKVNLDKD